MTSDENQSLSDDAAQRREPTVGQQLRAARDAQSLSLAQVSAQLRIEPQFLTCLEQDRFEVFSAPVFAKGYLKQYGHVLGLDERDLLAQYYRQVEARDVPVVPHKPIRLRDDDQIRHWMIAAFILLALGAGLAAWWFTRPAALNTAERAPPSGVEARLQAPVVEPSEPVDITPAPAELEDPAAEDGTAENDTAENDTVDAASREPAPPAASTGVSIEIVFSEDCWTEISDARGERLFYGLGSAGARSRFSATLPISIFLGNAAGVELMIDDMPYPIPADSRQGNLARFVIADPAI
jgi:cytoskeleton protein RodZ